jgi:hypothetical protein
VGALIHDSFFEYHDRIGYLVVSDSISKFLDFESYKGHPFVLRVDNRIYGKPPVAKFGMQEFSTKKTSRNSLFCAIFYTEVY